MKYIALTQGKHAIVDDADFEALSKYKWHYSKSSDNYGKAMASLGRRGERVRMHRLIMDAPKDIEVDHINGNPLDNRRSNLRLVSHSQNQKNMSKPTNNKSGYKGVSWHKRGRKWQVHLMNNGARVYLGLHEDIKEAARAYNRAAVAYFGEFARINEIKD